MSKKYANLGQKLLREKVAYLYYKKNWEIMVHQDKEY